MPDTIAAGPAADAQADEDISSFIASFERRLDAGDLNTRTIAIYVGAVRELEVFLRMQGMPLNVRGIRREHIESFLVEKRNLRRADAKQGWSESTRNHWFRSVAQFWKFLIDEDEIADSPMRKMHAPKIPYDPAPTLSLDQYELVQQAIRGQTFRDVRDRAILAVMYDTGVRRAELSGMTLDDLDLGARLITVIGSKDKRVRRVPFGIDTAILVDRYVRARTRWINIDRDRRVRLGDTPKLWLSERGRGDHGDGSIAPSAVNQIVRRRTTAAGFDGIHPHLFRHGAAHALLSSGLSEGDTMRVLGWKSRSMLDRYGASRAEDRAIDAYAAHSPVDKLRRR